MTVLEALQNARTFLEALGYGAGGDIHDDLHLAISFLQNHSPRTALAILPIRQENAA